MTQTISYAKQFLALSAGVSSVVLEEKDQQGHFIHARGRQKYYGLGGLVIFFAVFSGYGMGHMLSTMANMPSYGAIIAGCVWAIFQWCLERQMLLTITHDAKWVAKLFGFTWRSMLGFLSAITLVYPFFVDSNRAEIEVKIADIARTRLVENVATSKVAVGLPAMAQDLQQIQTERDQVEKELRSDPPTLAALKLKARQCWNQYNAQNKRMTLLNETEKVVAQLNNLRNRCQAADTQVANTLWAWKRQKTAEKNAIGERYQTQQNATDQAKNRGITLEMDYAKKVEVASQSGFAADFTAVADLLKNDINRRIQFIWWLTWFFIIELVAIIVKFMSVTDVDHRLNLDEKLLFAQMQHQFTQKMHKLNVEKLTMPTQVFQATLQEMQKMETYYQQVKTEKNTQRIDAVLNQSMVNLLELFSKFLKGAKNAI